MMSLARQEEIGILRKNALLRYMSRFTLTLGDEHLLCCTGSQNNNNNATSSSESEEFEQESVTSDSDSDKTSKDMERNGKIEEEERSKTSVECRGDMNMAQDSDSTTAADAAAADAAVAFEYTHLSLPLPGSGCASNTNDKPDKSLPNQQQMEVVKKVENRSAAINCAICLSEYEKCDRVCWSSNTECSHVFHEDCILQWLISSGEKKSMNQYFFTNPTDEKLLEKVICPCCLQDFIFVRPASCSEVRKVSESV
ncbi:hypothetical protein QTG54_005416 [Skeletonema marinoi]|uniref:RING-type domain-containing protein n=1 Tax=Skeletonema marinoi TaxID=267567 RepID=A0AAD9DF32_9STRA|nr:hypothetical protein QTG54_005416 [Skeletonema marinoi]